jgi:hypothetical protein
MCSSLGRFKRVIPYRNSKDGGLLKVFVNKTTGYCSVTLSSVTPRTYAAHKIIARAFVPNPNYYNVVMFKDGNKQNLRADNLYWSDSNNTFRKIPIWLEHIETGRIEHFKTINDTMGFLCVHHEKIKKAIEEKKSIFGWRVFDKNPSSHT